MSMNKELDKIHTYRELLTNHAKHKPSNNFQVYKRFISIIKQLAARPSDLSK